MKAMFEDAFLKSLKKHSSIKKQVQKKVEALMEHPVELGEPLRGDLQGFYSCPVKRTYIIIYLYCASCRKKGDDVVVACADCEEMEDETIKFVRFGPHDEAYWG